MQTNQPKRRDNVLIQDSGDETMLYDPTTDEMHVLNPTAHFIWKRCDGNYSIEQISNELKTKFAVGPAINVRGDVAQTLIEFGTKKLLQPSA